MQDVTTHHADDTPVIAAYVSGHGFGHAVRASVVLSELAKLVPSAHVVVSSDAPAWLFSALLPDVTVRRIPVDSGPVQFDGFTVDIDASLTQMASWLEGSEAWIRREAAWLQRQRASLVLADISPLSLAAAREARVPSALVANFTWDWILEHAGFPAESAARLAEAYGEYPAMAAWCFLPYPASAEVPHPRPVPVGMVGRQCTAERMEVRRTLGIPDDAAAVLLTFGGLDVVEVDFGPVATQCDVVFLSTTPRPTLPSCRTVDPCADHAALVHACDVIVGKLGYGTVVEALIHGTPVLYAPRHHWPEDDILRCAVENSLPSARVPWDRFRAGEWVEDLRILTSVGKAEGQPPYGGPQIAGLLASTLWDAHAELNCTNPVDHACLNRIGSKLEAP